MQSSTLQVQSPFAGLRRRDLEALTTRIIHQGRGYQSTVFLVEKDGHRAAVKDFSGTPPFFRLFIAPFLLAREINALRHLSGVAGVPQFYERIDRYAFAMQYIEGTPIATFSLGEIPPEVFPRVQSVIDAIHAHGVAHCDLKRRTNLILTPEGEVFLIDFAASVIGERTLHPFQNWLYREMVEVDNKSLPRLKKFVAPELLTEADRHKLDHPTVLEKWARRLLNR